MIEDITQFHFAPKTKAALSVLFEGMISGSLDSPDNKLTAGELVPLISMILQLAGDLEEMMLMLGQRMSMYEARVDASKPRALMLVTN